MCYRFELLPNHLKTSDLSTTSITNIWLLFPKGGVCYYFSDVSILTVLNSNRFSQLLIKKLNLLCVCLCMGVLMYMFYVCVLRVILWVYLCVCICVYVYLGGLSFTSWKWWVFRSFTVSRQHFLHFYQFPLYIRDCGRCCVVEIVYTCVLTATRWHQQVSSLTHKTKY